MSPNAVLGLCSLVFPVPNQDFERSTVQHDHIALTGERTAVFEGPEEVVTRTPNQDAVKRIQLPRDRLCSLFLLHNISVCRVEDARRGDPDCTSSFSEQHAQSGIPIAISIWKHVFKMAGIAEAMRGGKPSQRLRSEVVDVQSIKIVKKLLTLARFVPERIRDFNIEQAVFI